MLTPQFEHTILQQFLVFGILPQLWWFEGDKLFLGFGGFFFSSQQRTALYKCNMDSSKLKSSLTNVLTGISEIRGFSIIARLHTCSTRRHWRGVDHYFIRENSYVRKGWQFPFDIPITLITCPVFYRPQNPSGTQSFICLNCKTEAWWLCSVKLFDWFIDSASPLNIGWLKWHVDLRELSVIY